MVKHQYILDCLDVDGENKKIEGDLMEISSSGVTLRLTSELLDNRFVFYPMHRVLRLQRFNT